VLEPHAVAAIAVTIIALFLFTRDRMPVEFVCVAVLAVLILGFEIAPFAPVVPQAGTAALRGTDLLRGFGNEALITVCLLLIAVKGVEVTGALRPLGALLVRLWSRNRSTALLATLTMAALLSAFVNNTAIVVMLMPILIAVAHRIRMAPSRVLMPVCFATTMGGMTTTIGSSTNLLVVGIASQSGVESIGMFDFLLPGGVAAAVGILYLWLVAPRLLVDRPSALAGSAPKIFFAVIEIEDGSPAVGKTLAELVRIAGRPSRFERVQRGRGDLVRLPSLKLRVGDRLHLRGTAESIARIQKAGGTDFAAEKLRRAPAHRLVEAVVTRTSSFRGKRLSELQQLLGANLLPIGIQQSGAEPPTPIDEAGDPVLGIGDVLLMQGSVHDINALKDAHDCLVLDRSVHIPRSEHAGTAALILLAIVLAAAFGLVPIIASAFCGVTLMLLTRCLHWEEIWGAIDARLVLVIVTSLALGTTLTNTGATTYAAERFTAAVAGLPIPVALGLFLVTIALLNEVVSNTALAILGTPIAIGVAEQLGAPALPFVLALLFGANAGYITPIGYQTNLLVYTAGGYRFTDFFKVGAPLQVISWVTLSIALTLIYF
jgi:di/tricarboxylate transporter